MSKISGWTPRRRGDGLYCSPRCGRGCTRIEYERAKRNGRALAKRMGKGWRPVVWENLGWHYRVEKAVAHITEHSARRYTVYLNGTRQFIAEGRTPETALRNAVAVARKTIRTITAELAEVAA